MSCRDLKIRLKMNFGRNLFYPECEYSNLFAELLRCTSFTEEQLRLIVCLGYSLVISSDLNDELTRLETSLKEPKLVKGKGALS